MTKLLSVNSKLLQFTSESVTEGHPDKVCDLISDAILDDLLAQDPNSRVAVETLAARGFIQVAGEISTTGYVEIPDVVRRELLNIGYDSSAVGLDGKTCGVNVSIGAQSADIAQGVDASEESRFAAQAKKDADTDPYACQGAGDQGLMFGYACDETEALLPLPISLAHDLAHELAYVRKNGVVADLGPDGKTQVTIGYDGLQPVSLSAVVLSTQHMENWDMANLSDAMLTHVIAPTLKRYPQLDISQVKYHINPTGKFVIGGPAGDTGLTGRKLIVDTYGGMARHGGGAFSGKDPSKVDRCAAYAARWVAKNVVAAGLAKRCEVQVSYAIGRATPMGIFVDTFGTGQASDPQIAEAISEVFDLRPAAIIDQLDLKKPIYRRTAAYGHFGKPMENFSWEQTNRTAELLQALSL